MELIREVGELTKRISAIARLGQKWQTEMVLLALSCLAHAAAHGDITLATRLVNAMPQGGRRAALIDWVEAFAPVRYSKKEQSFVFPVAFGEVKDKFNLVGAEATPFYEYTPDRSTKELTLEQVIKTVSLRLKELQKEGKLTNAGVQTVIDTVNGFRNPVEGQDQTQQAA